MVKNAEKIHFNSISFISSTKMSSETATAAPGSVERVCLETEAGLLEHEERRWGVPLREMYRSGLRFYKEMEGKTLQLSYEDRLRLVAYTQQAVHGPLNDKTSPPPGVLDVIGRDRRAAWLALRDMSRVQAMAAFLHTLDRLCPMFKTYVEAIQKDAEEKELQEKRKKQEEEEKTAQEIHERLHISDEDQRVQRIKEALNAQTYQQFVEYAEQQCPGSVERQAVLVRQLQEQHYRQYVQQLALDQRIKHIETTEKEQMTEKEDTTEKEQLSEAELKDETTEDEKGDEGDSKEAEMEESEDGFPSIEEARMWTRPDAPAFKASVREAGGGGVLTVGHGETVTVRVPTHKSGRCLFWEFATDGFDIGFGVYFEWSRPASCEVTIHVADSEEEEEDDEYAEDDEAIGTNDVECGGGEAGTERGRFSSLKAPVSIVVPIYRRDCHQEVYVGSHSYPGEGVYLLKFDNTYSLWRSKTLYYKVYYTH